MAAESSGLWASGTPLLKLLNTHPLNNMREPLGA